MFYLPAFHFHVKMIESFLCTKLEELFRASLLKKKKKTIFLVENLTTQLLTCMSKQVKTLLIAQVKTCLIAQV